MALRVVLDTNVIFSAWRSGGDPARVLRQVMTSRAFVPCISTPLLLEYEDTLSRKLEEINKGRRKIPSRPLRLSNVQRFSMTVAATFEHYVIRRTPRPVLSPGNQKDEKVVDLVLVSEAVLVTGDGDDFQPAVERFGIDVVSVADFVERFIK